MTQSKSVAMRTFRFSRQNPNNIYRFSPGTLNRWRFQDQEGEEKVSFWWQMMYHNIKPYQLSKGHTRDWRADKAFRRK